MVKHGHIAGHDTSMRVVISDDYLRSQWKVQSIDMEMFKHVEIHQFSMELTSGRRLVPASRGKHLSRQQSQYHEE
jgi:hypothetical protein